MTLAESLADEGEEEAEAIYEFPTSCPTCGAELAFHRLGLDDAQLVLLCTADKARSLIRDPSLPSVCVHLSPAPTLRASGCVCAIASVCVCARARARVCVRV